MRSHAFWPALLVISLVAGAASAATSAVTSAVPADPWSLVPPLPTACYGDQDDFTEVLRTRIETLTHEIERQLAVNDEVAQRFGNMDFMEKQRRMSEYMGQHPQETTKIMQAFQAIGSQEANDARAQATQEYLKQRTALDASFARYRAAYDAAMAPFVGKIAAVNEEFTLWDSPKKKPINAQADQEYAKLCAQWWKTGPFLAELADYKKSLVQHIPAQDEEVALMKTNFAWAGISAVAYRSTATMEAVKHYMEWAKEVFEKRDETFSHRQ